MTQEQQILLAVLKSSLNPHIPLPKTDSCDWEIVFREANQQAVTLLFYDAIAPILPLLPPDIRQSVTQRGMRSIASNANVEKNKNKLVSFLEQEEQPYVILKGEAAAAYYPNPHLRALGDVDFLVQKESKEYLHKKFLQQGFEASNLEHSHHITYRKPGAIQEMHFEVAGIPNGTPGFHVRTFLADIFNDATEQELDGHTFYVPSHPHHGLVLLLHMQHHILSDGFGLRHLMDWGCYVNKTSAMSFWETQLLPFLKKIGLSVFAFAMTKTAALAFGTACPDWAQDVPDSLCQEILEDILEGGNLGKKDKTRKASSKMVSNHGKDGTNKSKLYYLWNTFHQTVNFSYPIVKKHPILYLVFYPVKGIRYLFLAATGKRESLIKAIPQANRRRELYGKLHIFEVNKNG